MSAGEPDAPPGVTSLEHTADVGLEVEAPDLPALFRRAALGMMWLILDSVPSGARETRRVTLEAPDGASLLRDWLRELLFWHEAEGFVTAGADFDVLEAGRLDARVAGSPAAASPVREIKGVTFHGLAVEPRNGGWWARVIFDV